MVVEESNVVEGDGENEGWREEGNTNVRSEEGGEYEGEGGDGEGEGGGEGGGGEEDDEEDEDAVAGYVFTIRDGVM